MKQLEYRIEISAPVKTVWETMLNEDTYKLWVAKSWPDSYYEGHWAKGEQIKFIGSDGGGTLAEIIEMKPYERVLARHIAILGPGGTEDRTSEVAKSWVGIMEEYRFTEYNGKTTVIAAIETNPEWSKMFDEGWPDALEELKKIAEHQLTSV